MKKEEKYSKNICILYQQRKMDFKIQDMFI